MSYDSPPDPELAPPPESPFAILLGIGGLLVGIGSCPGAIFPLCGCPLSVVGLIVSGVAVALSRGLGRALGVAGLAFSGIALAVTLVNAGWGAYQGATGQHGLLNLMGQ